jgi:hypothetical protein
MRRSLPALAGILMSTLLLILTSAGPGLAEVVAGQYGLESPTAAPTSGVEKTPDDAHSTDGVPRMPTPTSNGPPHVGNGMGGTVGAALASAR